jgi:Putative transposase
VTFTHRKVGSNRRRQMTLEATEFLRRFLQHVLPTGFQKVRSYGFLSPAGAVALELVRWLIAQRNGVMYALVARRDERPVAPLALSYPVCGGMLVRVGFVPAGEPAILDTS